MSMNSTARAYRCLAEQFRAGVGDQVSEGGHPGSCSIGVSVSSHALLKQYLCSGLFMSSEFSRAFFEP